jgi:type II secretory pathway pseudopilin PulG
VTKGVEGYKIQGVQSREIDELFKHSLIRERRDNTTTIKTFSEGQSLEPVNPRILDPFHVSFMGKKGFTLIEIIILIVLAGIIIPVIVVPFVTGIRMSNKPEMVTTAMYLAHQKMEEFMKYNYCDAALNPTALTSYAGITGFSGYQWQWSIYYVDNNFQNQDLVTDRGYKRILVRVSDPMLIIYEIYSVVTRW